MKNPLVKSTVSNDGHEDSEYGYTTVEVSFENDPRVDRDKLLDSLFETTHKLCMELTGDSDTCAIEHYESAHSYECLFADEFGNVRHSASLNAKDYS